VEKLKEKTAEKKEKTAAAVANTPCLGEDGDNMKTQERASATVQRPESDENTEGVATEDPHEAASQNFDPPWLEYQVSEGIAHKVCSCVRYSRAHALYVCRPQLRRSVRQNQGQRNEKRKARRRRPRSPFDD
jgi:hypothetical protein